ncbi:GDSL esterase/lipase lip-4 [Phtheirospermum japonicum]|uniref:GDSL esterase/lipase lip-4 n=1 Tax=Phtheirospermum japonicum TaxID=374723 RepID=A0A830DD49_9LAMI|nr:GDSL esterase/lipase lip-4 [Phtheirospermum japonicum]
MQIFSLHLLTFLALTIHLRFVVSQCSRTNRPVIFNFGDSNSDTGGQTAGLGLEAGYPYGRAFFRRPTGRVCDGRLVIDFLCEYLDTHYLSPYLDSLEPDFSNGANFAISGSCTLPRFLKFNLNIQILQFKHFYNRSVELNSKGHSNLVGEDDFKNALYTIDIGQNDLAGSFGSLSYAQAIERIPSFISEIKDALWAIYQLGGRNFWVHNTGPLGCLPLELATRDKLNNSDFDQYGCIKSFNDGAKAFNAKLNALCEELRSQMENSTIVYVDMYSIKYDLIANSTSYGFKNPLMACCGYGGTPYNCDPDYDKTCLGSQYDVCDEGTPYISWDGTHYTEAANAIVASKVLSTHYSSPPLEFNFFCNSVGNLFELV